MEKKEKLEKEKDEEKEEKVEEEEKEETKEEKPKKKDNKKTIIGLLVVIIVLLLLLAFLLWKTLNKPVTITFKTDGGTAVEQMKVKKGSELTLPTTTKDGYNFLGWYINNKKLKASIKVEKDLTVTAKWDKIPEGVKTFTITFDSKGGSKVENLTLECDKEITLPNNPTREGYTFTSWVDKNETPILDKALLACEDVTLYANWEKKEEPKKEEKKEYTCPPGYGLDGTKCRIQGTVSERCPSGTHSYSGVCVTLTYNARKDYEYTCKQEFITYMSYAQMTDGIPVSWGRMGCAYYKTSDTSKETCESHQFTWVTPRSECYVKYVGGEANLEKTCNHLSGYVNVQNPNFDGVHGLNGGCYPTSPREKYCEGDYTFTDGKCIKVIDATLK